jgi:pimeloyl-ACP methyl ester carboxylesterase
MVSSRPLTSPLTATAVLMAALLALSGCSATFDDRSAGQSPTTVKDASEGSPAPDPQRETKIDWTDCDDSVNALSGLECGELEVPLDPNEPDGDTTTLALARARSTGTADERIGSLIINPGGPGGSGVEFLGSAAPAFPSELTDRFDLVSFDPRGVGASDPVRCLDDTEKDEELSVDLTPDTAEEQAEVDRLADRVRIECEQRNPELSTHMSTADVAADVDRIRSAVGDEKLSYLGFSYGSSIGAVYATLFPERVRAVVLDGSTDPNASAEEQALTQANGFERALDRFVAACDASTSCPLAPGARAKIEEARASLDAQPVEVDANGITRTLGPDLFDFGLATALYDTSLWQSTAQAVVDLRSGGAAKLLALVDRQVGRNSDGTYDNSSDAQIMVNCSDDVDRLDAEAAAAAEDRIVAAAPRFGPLLGTGLDDCNAWPEPTNPIPSIAAPESPTVLVVGTVGDPATPYEWSQRMVEALGSAELLTYEGDGHTAFLTAGPCITEAVTKYLVDLTVPPVGSRCPAAAGADPFAGLGETVIEQLAAGGIPRTLAECIVEKIVEEVGENEFERIILENDVDALTKLATAQTLACATTEPRN